MEVKSAVVFVLKPTVCLLFAIFLRHLNVNLVEGEEFLMRLDHLVHEGHRVVAVDIGVCVNCGVAYRLLPLEIVDEIGKVEVRVVKSIDSLELFAVLSLVPPPRIHKIPVEV